MSAADQGDVAARPADIDGDQIFDPCRAADLQAADDTGRRARQEEPHRTLPGDGGGADAAPRLHDLQRRLNTVLRQILLHGLEIASDHRFDIGIERRHAGALVLAEGRIDLGGQGDHDLRVTLGNDLARPPLMRRIEEREQVADRDRFDACGDQLVDRVYDRTLVQRDKDIPRSREALATSLRNAPGARNTGVSGLRTRSYTLCRIWRPISSTSLKPTVVRRPILAPFASITALVAAVVPCTKRTISSGDTRHSRCM